MRLRAKKDDNHNEIADTFRKLGWSWKDTHQLGDGFPDGIAGRAGINVIVEIKDGDKSPSQRRLTPDEKEFHAEWRGPIAIIETVQQVIDFHRSVIRGMT